MRYPVSDAPLIEFCDAITGATYAHTDTDSRTVTRIGVIPCKQDGLARLRTAAKAGV